VAGPVEIGALEAPLRVSALRAQLPDLVLVHAEAFGEPLVHQRVHNSKSLDDEISALDDPLKVVVAAQRVDLLAGPPKQREPGEVAPVGLKQRDIEALDPPFLLGRP
jgi:hypothetical protein